MRTIEDELLQSVGVMASKFQFHVFAMNSDLQSWHIEKEGKRILSNQSINSCFAFFLGYIKGLYDNAE